MPKMVEQAYKILGFKGSQDRIMDLTLEQLYNLFILLNVSYANIMDFTCRACSIGIIPQSLTNDIYNLEQSFTNKSTAFGRRNKSKKRNKSMSLTHNKRTSYHKTKRYKNNIKN